MYKQRELLDVPREDAVQDLEEDEYFIADLIGMQVVLTRKAGFGTLTDVMETGANDVYVVENGEGEEILASGHQRMYSGCGCGRKMSMTSPSDERI